MPNDFHPWAYDRKWYRIMASHDLQRLWPNRETPWVRDALRRLISHMRNLKD